MATRYIEPICGLDITASNVGASIECNEQMIYLCSAECRDIFMEDPLRYTVDEDEDYDG